LKITTRMCACDIYVSYPTRMFVARTHFRWKFVVRATLQACCPMHNGVEHGHACRFAPTRERYSLVRRCSSSLCVNLRLTSVTHRRKTRKPRLEHAQPCLAHATALPSPLEDERTEQDSLILTGLTRRGFIANTGFSKYKIRLSFQLIGVLPFGHHTSYFF
jgi:hypothetical protein